MIEIYFNTRRYMSGHPHKLCSQCINGHDLGLRVWFIDQTWWPWGFIVFPTVSQARNGGCSLPTKRKGKEIRGCMYVYSVICAFVSRLLMCCVVTVIKGALYLASIGWVGLLASALFGVTTLYCQPVGFNKSCMGSTRGISPCYSSVLPLHMNVACPQPFYMGPSEEGFFQKAFLLLPLHL